MSSTGIITKTVMTPTTEYHEQSRSVEGGIGSAPGLQEGTRQVYGTIYDIHPEKPLVKCYDESGSPIACDKWIPLNHSSQEIAERYGTVRMGMNLLVSFVGPDGAGANATIVGNVGEKNLNEPLTPNTAQRGMFRIFAPGTGIG